MSECMYECMYDPGCISGDFGKQRRIGSGRADGVELTSNMSACLHGAIRVKASESWSGSTTESKIAVDCGLGCRIVLTCGKTGRIESPR